MMKKNIRLWALLSWAMLSVFLLLTPHLAGAATNMQVTSSALPATGGSITPNGLKFFSGAASYTISVNAGWSISSILIDGVAQAISTSKTVSFDTSKAHTIKVTFSQGTYSIATSAGPGGQLQITGGGATNIPSGSSRGVIVAPSTGYRIHSYLVDGGAPVVPADPTVAATIPFTNITANHSVSASFDLVPAVTVYVGPVQSLTANGNPPWSTTLNGSASSNLGAITCQWDVTAEPAGATATFGDRASAATTFNVDRPGIYTVTLTATSGGVTVTSAPATITVQTATQAASSPCITCHTGSAQVVNWQSSIHATSPGGAACPSCHMPNGEAHHGLSFSSMGNICRNCHIDDTGNVANHPVVIGTNSCVPCHNPHTTAVTSAGIQNSAVHYNNITSGMYPASYVTSRLTCLDCHSGSSANLAIRQQWYTSGHAKVYDAPWIYYDFKARSGCVQCHSTTGFIAYSTGKITAAWGMASDKTKEVLTCAGCHKDITTGAIRAVPPVRPFASDSYTNRNVATSNICMNCHSGTNNGTSITVQVDTADFTNLPFVAPHYLAAGGTLHGKAGYHFPGQTYAFYSSNSHRLIGMADAKGTGSAGPCVICHKNTNGHTFKAEVVAVCANCHGSYLQSAKLDAVRTAFTNGLDVLKATLAYRNFVYSDTYPYFNNTDWGFGQAGANTMGAAFNFVLLRKEPGAFAHNSAYSRKLLTDSIDAAYNNGSVTGDIDSVLAILLQAGAITQEQSDGLAAYRKVTGCRMCHTNLGGAHAVHVGDLPDSVSAYGDDGSYSTPSDYRFGCGNCHPLDASKHGNGFVELELYSPDATGFKKNNPVNAGRTGTGDATVCLNVYCHSSGQDAGVRTYTATPPWGGAFTGNRCAGCHGDPPTYASGGADSASANSHYSQSWDNGQLVEGGHLVGLHFDNIKKDPADSLQPLFPKGGGPGSGAGHGDPATSTTVSCPTCHAATVNLPSMQSAPGTAFDCAACHGAQPGAVIADKSRHVNGTRDVVFMTGDFRSRAQIRLANFTSVIKPLGWTRNNGYKTYDSYDSVPFNGNYNPGDKSCVTSCHLNQSVKWGDTDFNCSGCHADL